MSGNHIANMNDRPSPEELLHYADSQAHRILQSIRFPPDKRTITVAFVPSAQTNLEAVSHWIHGRLIAMEHLQCADLRPDGNLAAKLEVSFHERLEAAFTSLSVFN